MLGEAAGHAGAHAAGATMATLGVMVVLLRPGCAGATRRMLRPIADMKNLDKLAGIDLHEKPTCVRATALRLIGGSGHHTQEDNGLNIEQGRSIRPA